MTFANDKGDNALLEFFHEKGPVNPFESLRTETSTLKGKVGELERALKAYDDATAAVKEQKMVRFFAIKTKLYAH